MPSVITLCLREQIRLLKPIFTNFSIPASRGFQEKLGGLGAKAVSGKVEYHDYAVDGIPMSMAVPAESTAGRDGRIALYLHGGGYVAGSIKYARGFAGVLAAKTGLHVLCAAYRLAPEHPYPAAVEDAFTAYEHLLSLGYMPENIFLIGESAGGGLIFSLCLYLKQKGFAMPAGLVGLSPWTDLAMTGNSIEENKKRDVSLTARELEGFVEAYAPWERHTPLASPLYGALEGLPPCRIYTGGDEILLDDSIRMAERLQEAGVTCTLTVAEGLWHAYVLYGVPEANEALDEIRRFFEEN